MIRCTDECSVLPSFMTPLDVYNGIDTPSQGPGSGPGSGSSSTSSAEVIDPAVLALNSTRNELEIHKQMNSSCRIITKPKNFLYGPGVEMILSQGVGQWLSDLPPFGIRPLVVDEYPVGFNTKDLSVYLPQILNNLTGSSSSNGSSSGSGGRSGIGKSSDSNYGRGGGIGRSNDSGCGRGSGSNSGSVHGSDNGCGSSSDDNNFHKFTTSSHSRAEQQVVELVQLSPRFEFPDNCSPFPGWQFFPRPYDMRVPLGVYLLYHTTDYYISSASANQLPSYVHIVPTPERTRPPNTGTGALGSESCYVPSLLPAGLIACEFLSGVCKPLPEGATLGPGLRVLSPATVAAMIINTQVLSTTNSSTASTTITSSSATSSSSISVIEMKKRCLELEILKVLPIHACLVLRQDQQTTDKITPREKEKDDSDQYLPSGVYRADKSVFISNLPYNVEILLLTVRFEVPPGICLSPGVVLGPYTQLSPGTIINRDLCVVEWPRELMIPPTTVPISTTNPDPATVTISVSGAGIGTGTGFGAVLKSTELSTTSTDLTTRTHIDLKENIGGIFSKSTDSNSTQGQKTRKNSSVNSENFKKNNFYQSGLSRGQELVRLLPQRDFLPLGIGHAINLTSNLNLNSNLKIPSTDPESTNSNLQQPNLVPYLSKFLLSMGTFVINLPIDGSLQTPSPQQLAEQIEIYSLSDFITKYESQLDLEILNKNGTLSEKEKINPMRENLLELKSVSTDQDPSVPDFLLKGVVLIRRSSPEIQLPSSMTLLENNQIPFLLRTAINFSAKCHDRVQLSLMTVVDRMLLLGPEGSRGTR